MQNVGVTGRYVRKPVVRCMVTTFKDQWHSTLRAGSKVVVLLLMLLGKLPSRPQSELAYEAT